MRALSLLFLVACHTTIEDGFIIPDDVAADSNPIQDDADVSVPDAMPVPEPTGTRVAVVVGYGGKRARTEDGVTWTDFVEIDHDGGDDGNLLRGIGFGAGKFVAVGGGGSHGLIMTSTDGKAWSAPDRSARAWIGNVTYMNGKYILAGGNGLRMWSTDAATWTEAGEHQTVHYRDITSNGTIAVAVGHTTVMPTIGIIATTVDGVNWIERRRGGQQHGRIVFGNGAFVAAGHAGKIERSTDGITWTEVALASSGVVDIAFTGTEFVATSGPTDQLRHYRSTDGITWSSQPAVQRVHAAFGGRYLHLGWPAKVLATENLSTWSNVFNPAGTGLSRMAEGALP